MNNDHHPDQLKNEIVEMIPRLRTFARRFQPRQHDAEDLVQETLSKAFANLDKFKPGTNLKSWLFTILRNTFCTNHGRAKREPVGKETCVAAQLAVGAGQEWHVQALDFAREMERLPVHYRAAIELILLEEMSYVDAALSSGCPVGTMKSRVNRGRSILLERLG